MTSYSQQKERSRTPTRTSQNASGYNNYRNYEEYLASKYNKQTTNNYYRQ